jgi:hypothetical protein
VIANHCCGGKEIWQDRGRLIGNLEAGRRTGILFFMPAQGQFLLAFA